MKKGDKMKKENTALKTALHILLGALLMGLLWRVRGEHGWGSSWGLLNAGFVFTIFLVVVKGSRQKLDIGWLSLTALSFMLTTPGWGTLLSQITGIIYDAEDWSVGGSDVYTSVGSAVFLMLCLGFGLASLFGIMLGRGFSEKQWKIKDIVILLGVFYITDSIASAVISPFILNAVQPEAAQVFEKGLEIQGIDGSAYQVYMEHFKDVSWAKKIDGGRNYFQSCDVITSTIKAIASLLTVRFIIKDKVSAKTGLVVCSAFAIGITVADLFFYFGNGGYHELNPSYLPEFFYAWGCWEYFTGFIAGGIITAFILKLKPQKDVSDLAFQKVPEKPKAILTFILGTLFMLGVNIVRPVLVRFEDSDFMIIATVIAVVYAIIMVIAITKGYGFNASKIHIEKYYAFLLLFFVTYIEIVYLLIGTPDCTHLFANGGFQHTMAILSAAAIMAWIIFNNKKLLETKGE